MGMRESLLPFHIPELGEDEIKLVTEVLRSPWLTSGPKVAEFEKLFAEAVGAKHALAVNSCTAALHLALDAMGLQAGDEVLVPTMTFTATAETVLYFKAKPVLVDVSRETQNIDLEDAARKVTSKTKAIMPVHVAGLPCDMPSIKDFAKKYHLHVIEDAAHAFPAASHGKPIGAISEMTAFSFYATKTITTGEGGMLTTDNDQYADRARLMRIHGMNRDAWKRQGANADGWSYEVVEAGYKYNLTDIAAAIGIPQLKKAERMRADRERIAAYYDEALSDLKDLILLPPHEQGEGSKHSWHLYTLRLQIDRLKISRGEFISQMKNRNIATSVHWIPLHLHPFYRKTFGYKPEDFPNATWLSERIVSLPIFAKMNEQDRLDVVAAVRDVLGA